MDRPPPPPPPNHEPKKHTVPSPYNMVKRFVNSDCNPWELAGEVLTVTVPQTVWPQSYHLHDKLGYRGIGFDYNPEKNGTLRVWKTSPFNYLLIGWMINSFFWNDQCRTTDVDEMRLLCRNTDRIHLPVSAQYLRAMTESSKTFPVIIKTPAFAVGPMSTKFPPLVMEIGASEKYDELLADATEWFVRARGHIKVVILIMVDEAPIKHKYNGLESPPSETENLDRDMILDEFEHLDASQLVGELSVRLELWRLEDGKDYAELAHKVSILPAEPIERDPFVTIQDLVPPSIDSTPGDPNRRLRFPLAALRKDIEHASRHWATDRIKAGRRRCIAARNSGPAAPARPDVIPVRRAPIRKKKIMSYNEFIAANTA